MTRRIITLAPAVALLIGLSITAAQAPRNIATAVSTAEAGVTRW